MWAFIYVFDFGVLECECGDIFICGYCGLSGLDFVVCAYLMWCVDVFKCRFGGFIFIYLEFKASYRIKYNSIYLTKCSKITGNVKSTMLV